MNPPADPLQSRCCGRISSNLQVRVTLDGSAKAWKFSLAPVDQASELPLAWKMDSSRWTKSPQSRPSSGPRREPAWSHQDIQLPGKSRLYSYHEKLVVAIQESNLYLCRNADHHAAETTFNTRIYQMFYVSILQYIDCHNSNLSQKD